MRSRTINHLSNATIWWLLALLPLVVVALYTIHNGSGVDAFINSLDGMMAGVPLYDTVDQLIGLEGYLPLVSTRTHWMVDYTTWMVVVAFLRMCVTVITFIPLWFTTFADKALQRARGE